MVVGAPETCENFQSKTFSASGGRVGVADTKSFGERVCIAQKISTFECNPRHLATLCGRCFSCCDSNIEKLFLHEVGRSVGGDGG
jgi:hypothetical protein